ncbi:homoserine dehydrogenase [Pseudoclavibacter soli]|uniref:homoserine dehydrogenase n=1 Tax=Pseudoclavibacter soli TaxID=452623 RepID=UPI0004227047|nr:homoserine dehydrogenase [Pseudoclavibacter soli]
MTERTLKVALLGAGSVGAQTARQLIERRAELAQRIGADFELIGIAVRNPAGRRDVELPAELFTTDAEGLIDRADIVIELIGGIEPARTYIERALRQGKDVVTANKALLAAHQVELFEVGRAGGAETYYEAAAAAAIPIIRPLQDSLVGDRINRVLGIVNGSTNYVLDRIDQAGITLDEALKEASDLGYLEADPTADVEGHDAAAKATILAGLAFHTHVPRDAVYTEGITKLTTEQLTAAKEGGFVVKLLAIAERLQVEPGESEAVNVRVYPALVPVSHPLAAVHGGKNAIFVEALDAGDLMFYGAGAGGVETSSTVLSDFVLAARRIVRGAPAEYVTFDANLRVADISEVTSSWQITLHVADLPGVLEQVAAVLSRNEVSVRDLSQVAAGPDAREAATGTARLIIITHPAHEGRLQRTVAELGSIAAVHEVAGVIRVEGI